MWDKCPRLSGDIYPLMKYKKLTWGQMPLSRNVDVFTEFSMKTSLTRNYKHRIRISIRIPDGRLTPTIFLVAAPLKPLSGLKDRTMLVKAILHSILAFAFFHTIMLGFATERAFDD